MLSPMVPERVMEKLRRPKPIEIRPVTPVDPANPQPIEPVRHLWFRADGSLPDSPALHKYLLAYASDFSFIGTALQPHGVSSWSKFIQLASLDHAIWFHREVKMDDWLLYSIDSPGRQCPRLRPWQHFQPPGRAGRPGGAGRPDPRARGLDVTITEVRHWVFDIRHPDHRRARFRRDPPRPEIPEEDDILHHRCAAGRRSGGKARLAAGARTRTRLRRTPGRSPRAPYTLRERGCRLGVLSPAMPTSWRR